MHPYLPFAALPLAVAAAWFAASHWSSSEYGRYQLPPVKQIEAPAVPSDERSQVPGKSDIRVAAFLPHVPPKPPAPDPTLILHSVMTGNDVDLATINGQVVREGDSIAGYQVMRITADGVELANAVSTRKLPMRSLHELPPPSPPGADLEQQNVAGRNDESDLARNFWATFNSPQPQI